MDDFEVFSLIYKSKNFINFSIILNIFFVYKNCRKGFLFTYKTSEKQSNKIDKLLEHIGLYYQKYLNKNRQLYIYIISKNKIKYDLYTKHTSIPYIKNSDKIGKHLGYLCDSKALYINSRRKRYCIRFDYINSEYGCNLYSYVCTELNIDNIYKELNRVTKMNNIIKKILKKSSSKNIISKILNNSYIKLSIEKC